MERLQSMRKDATALKNHAIETALYLLYRFLGGNYADYYTKLTDRTVTSNPQWGMTTDHRFQVEYLKKQGLELHHRVLDYGCGAIAAGLSFIEYLAPDNYTGADISAQALKEGWQRIAN